MRPSSQSWPPKLNRDTGQNSGRGFNVVVVRVPCRAAILLDDWSNTGERATVPTRFDDGVFLLAVEPLT
jgi:hypothetical protein